MMAGKTIWKIIPQNFMTFGSKMQVFFRENKTNSYTRGYLWASEVYVTIKLFT